MPSEAERRKILDLNSSECTTRSHLQDESHRPTSHQKHPISERQSHLPLWVGLMILRAVHRANMVHVTSSVSAVTSVTLDQGDNMSYTILGKVLGYREVRLRCVEEEKRRSINRVTCTGVRIYLLDSRSGPNPKPNIVCTLPTSTPTMASR